jgi:glutaredoxin 3
MKIDIYSTPSCGYCKIAKEYFKARDLPFNEYNVAEDIEKRNEMLALSGATSVPVVVVDNGEEKPSIMVGYNKEKLDKVFSK